MPVKLHHHQPFQHIIPEGPYHTTSVGFEISRYDNTCSPVPALEANAEWNVMCQVTFVLSTFFPTQTPFTNIYII